MKKYEEWALKGFQQILQDFVFFRNFKRFARILNEFKVFEWILKKYEESALRGFQEIPRDFNEF